MNKKETKAQEYLIKSMKLMQRNGFNGTSVKDITDELGIPKGSFYNYYENKADYTIKALEVFYDYIASHYYAVLADRNIPPKERILKAFKSKVQGILNKELEYGCFIGKLSLELNGTEDSILDVIDNLHERMRKGIQTCLQEDAAMDADKAEYTASIITYLWQGALMRYGTSNDKKHLEHLIKALEDLLR